jgi:hypothetical protein
MMSVPGTVIFVLFDYKFKYVVLDPIYQNLPTETDNE